MQLIARLYQPDIAILPIGGHYTMDPHEAAFALELLGVQTCIPCTTGRSRRSRARRSSSASSPTSTSWTPQPGETIELPAHVTA